MLIEKNIIVMEVLLSVTFDSDHSLLCNDTHTFLPSFLLLIRSRDPPLWGGKVKIVMTSKYERYGVCGTKKKLCLCLFHFCDLHLLGLLVSGGWGFTSVY